MAHDLNSDLDFNIQRYKAALRRLVGELVVSAFADPDVRTAAGRRQRSRRARTPTRPRRQAASIDRTRGCCAAGGCCVKYDDNTPLKLPVPIFEIAFRTEDGLENVLMLEPNDIPALLAASTLAYASALPIDEETVHRLAELLGVEPNLQFNLGLHEVIVESTLVIIRGWHGPRWARNFFDRLIAKPEATIAAARNDSTASFLVNYLGARMELDANDPLAAVHAKSQFVLLAKEARSIVTEAIKPGAPGRETRQMFFEAVVGLAYEVGADLRLPQRDSGRARPTTPLFDFAVEMRDLLAAYGRRVLMNRGAERFDDLARLRRGAIVSCLQRARKTIQREIKNDEQVRGWLAIHRLSP
jgi:hypothetical protein